MEDDCTTADRKYSICREGFGTNGTTGGCLCNHFFGYVGGERGQDCHRGSRVDIAHFILWPIAILVAIYVVCE